MKVTITKDEGSNDGYFLCLNDDVSTHTMAVTAVELVTILEAIQEWEGRVMCGCGHVRLYHSKTWGNCLKSRCDCEAFETAGSAGSAGE